MALDVTKQGNLYKTTNAGKAIGLATGGALGYKYIGPKIKEYIRNSAPEKLFDTFESGGLNSMVKDGKFLHKLSKYSGPIGAAIAGIACCVVGGFFDSCVNYGRQVEADKKARLNKK